MCNICRSCKAINIERKTYYDWLKKFPIFKQRIEEVKENLTDMVESQLLENGNQKAVEFYLINRKKNKYSNKQDIEITKPEIVKETVFVKFRKPPKRRI